MRRKQLNFFKRVEWEGEDVQRLSGDGTMIILIRHGEQVIWPLETQEDVNKAPLTEKGRQQALQVALRLQSVSLVAIYSSPYQRCLQTAHIVRERQMSPVFLEVKPDLREWGYPSLVSSGTSYQIYSSFDPAPIISALQHVLRRAALL